MSLVVIDGSSSPHGWFAGSNGGWPNRLLLDEIRYNEVHGAKDAPVVLNHALPRAPLSFIVQHVAPNIGPLHKFYGNNTVRLLTAGLNETAIINGQSQPAINREKFAGLLGRYAEIGAEIGINTIYIGPQAIDDNKTNPIPGMPFSLKDDFVDEYSGIVRKHAEQQGSPFIDVRELFDPYGNNGDLSLVQSADGIHFNEIIHEQIYKRVVPLLGEFGIRFSDN